MTTFLCYDLKGIQSFIFQVPRLRYISGGSALVDRFDRSFAADLSIPGVRLLFSGGGRGAFLCESEEALRDLESRLVAEAHDMGASIALGTSPDYSTAAHAADRLIPFLPSAAELEGRPCPASGLFPVRGSSLHPALAARLQHRRHYEEEFCGALRHPLFAAGVRYEFMSDVSPDASDPDGSPDDARAGAAALGGRNRWAVIAMDGNDMGLQFRHQERRGAVDFEWLSRSSRALDEATRKACRAGAEAALAAWAAGSGPEVSRTRNGTLVLPFRPLIVGGDDIVVLCHAAHAFDFVDAAARAFERETGKTPDLWSATGGRLSISAGVLFAPVSLPLATAVDYAESLLASAKGRGRKEPRGEGPTPACIDWETVTGGLLDTPAASRARDWRFLDPDLGEEVLLTRRPYRLEDVNDLLRAAREFSASVPLGVLHDVAEALRTPYWERRRRVARLRKNHPALAAAVDESRDGLAASRWRLGADSNGRKSRSTDVLDAIERVLDSRRMERPTMEVAR